LLCDAAPTNPQFFADSGSFMSAQPYLDEATLFDSPAAAESKSLEIATGINAPKFKVVPYFKAKEMVLSHPRMNKLSSKELRK